ncbi:hypothetical protein YTPLAS72_29420 [Nitrospira sp.]|nr:hypothetical protein YTPLAS72_29420 [Nitrospira sp.]
MHHEFHRESLPTPANTIFEAGTPAFNARYNSPRTHNIHSAAFSGHESKNRKIGVRLHSKGDDMRNVLERAIVCMEMADQRLMAIDVAGGAKFLSDSADWHLLTVQLAVVVLETMHGAVPQ